MARSERAQARVSSYRDTRSRSLQRMVRRCGHVALRYLEVKFVGMPGAIVPPS